MAFSERARFVWVAEGPFCRGLGLGKLQVSAQFSFWAWLQVAFEFGPRRGCLFCFVWAVGAVGSVSGQAPFLAWLWAFVVGFWAGAASAQLWALCRLLCFGPWRGCLRWAGNAVAWAARPQKSPFLFFFGPG
ncbi:hypothetical protein OIU85_014237 [Salix viminalis]|uniref:Uncharacterized protein n=1 Tax=Salix viminalis TaxID=40686 RepID=A0A9Q0NNG4_SALVM|nr:hypothetical protein OIU85_014237 [Salix viminalis]